MMIQQPTDPADAFVASVQQTVFRETGRLLGVHDPFWIAVKGLYAANEKLAAQNEGIARDVASWLVPAVNDGVSEVLGTVKTETEALKVVLGRISAALSKDRSAQEQSKADLDNTRQQLAADQNQLATDRQAFDEHARSARQGFEEHSKKQQDALNQRTAALNSRDQAFSKLPTWKRVLLAIQNKDAIPRSTVPAPAQKPVAKPIAARSDAAAPDTVKLPNSQPVKVPGVPVVFDMAAEVAAVIKTLPPPPPPPVEKKRAATDPVVDVSGRMWRQEPDKKRRLTSASSPTTFLSRFRLSRLEIGIVLLGVAVAVAVYWHLYH